MIYTFTKKKGRRYGYYLCSRHHNEGADTCPEARVSAGKFEQHVAEQIQIIGQDPELLAKTAAAVAKAAVGRKKQLTSERRRIEQERRRLDEAAEIDDRLHVLEERLGDVHAEMKAVGNADVDEEALRDALAGFTPIWEQLFPREQERILQLLIGRVTYDPDGGDVDIELRPCGIAALAKEAREAS